MSYPEDDDFSPEDAFNLFTPSIYRPGVRDRPDFDLIAPPGVDPFTLDGLSSVTLAAVGGGPLGGGGVRAPPVHLSPPGGSGSIAAKLNASLSQFVVPTPLDDGTGSGNGVGWILGEREDAILLPVVLSVIGLCALLGNVLLLLTIAGLRRMRSGPNMMLANVALADIVFVAVTVPVAVVNHATRSAASIDDDVIGPRMCRFVYYVVFVTVYVAVYTLVVSSVFRFFGQLMRGSGPSASRRRPPHAGVDSLADTRAGKSLMVGGASPSSPDGAAATGSHPVPLSTCSAAVSCAVVWIAFAASHLTFVVQSDITGLAAFEKPVICVYSPSSLGGVGAGSGGHDVGSGGGGNAAADVSRVRTLWITFLACAFLLPLAIVCCTSAAVLRMQRRAVHHLQIGRRRVDLVGDDELAVGRALAGSPVVDDATVVQNLNNDGRSKREMTTIIMTSAVARAVCWLPLQIFVLVDVFGDEPEPEATADMYRKAEMFGVCMALVGACVGPPIYRVASNEFRDAFRLVLRRVCCCGSSGAGSRRSPPRNASYVSSRLVAREPSLTALTIGVGMPTTPSVEYQRHVPLRQQSPMSSSSSSTCYSHDHHQHMQQHSHLLHQQQHQQLQRQQQQQQQQQQMVHKHQLFNARPEVQQQQQLVLAGRTSSSDVHETILSIISDSSNHINYS